MSSYSAIRNGAYVRLEKRVGIVTEAADVSQQSAKRFAMRLSKIRTGRAQVTLAVTDDTNFVFEGGAKEAAALIAEIYAAASIESIPITPAGQPYP